MSASKESWTRIPMPELLTEPKFGDRGNRDPQRSGEDEPVSAAVSNAADGELAVYAQQLWAALDDSARYLREQVARGGSGPLLANKGPLLSTDEQWQRWCATYAGVLGVLAGPAGDQGYGRQEAQLEYQNGFLYR